MVLSLLLIMLMRSLPAPGYARLVIIEGEAVNPYRPIIEAVTEVESSKGKNLYNAKEEAVGWFGIRPIRLNDYNKRTGKNITLDQCYSYEVGEMIFLYYASQIDYRDIKAICISWNGISKRNLYYGKVKQAML
jgi:hypothetical protein